MSVEAPKQTRSMVRDLLVLLRDNQLLTDKECADQLAISERTVFILRRSDAFRATLAKMIEDQHGEAIRAVRNSTLVAANEAFEWGRRTLKDVAVMPSVKLETAKLLFDQHNKAQQREHDMAVALIPPPAPPAPVMTPANQVNVTISVEALTEARNAAITHGSTIELEPSDCTHTAGLLQQPRHLQPSFEATRPQLRSERPKSIS